MSTPVQEDLAATIAKRHPWLRSDPATLTGEPPSTFESLWKSHKARWEQVFLEFLRDGVGDIAQSILVDAGEDAATIEGWYFEVSQPGTKAERRTYLNGKFDTVYKTFTDEVRKIQTAVDARVKQLQDEAKQKGEKVPSTKEARQQTGKEVGKAAVKQQLAEQRKTLGNINVALIANLQLKEYQVNALQQFNIALNNLGSAKWDEPDPKDESKSKGPSPEKEEALAVLGASGTAMFDAYGEVSATVAAITSLGPGVETPQEAIDKLAEDLLLFGKAIAAQSEAMGKAGRLFTQWSMRVTREFIRENFASIYPYAGAGFLALRTLCTLTEAVSSSFPGYGWIGSVASAADSAVEGAVTNLVAWKDAQDPETRKKYALQKFEIDEEHKRDVMVVAHKAKKGIDDFIDKIEDNTIGVVTDKITNVVDDKVKAAAAAANISPSEYATLKRRAGQAYEVVKIPASVMGVDLEVPSLGDAAKGLVEKAIEQAPGGGAIIAAGKIFFDVAEFYAAVCSHLENADGVTDKDVEQVRQLIDAPPQHQGFQLFAKGQAVVYEGMNYPVVYLRLGKAQFGLNLRTHAVTITDDKMISDEMLGYAQKWAKKDPNDGQGLRFVGRVYQPDWGSWKLHLDRSVNSPFQVSMKALYKAPDKDYPVDLELTLDLDFEELAITRSSLKLDPKGLDEKLRHNAVEAAPVPITTDDLARFVGRQVDAGGKALTLARFDGGGVRPASKAARVSFDMIAEDEAKSATEITLLYVVDQELQVEKVGRTLTEAEAKAEKAAAADAALGALIKDADRIFDEKRARGENITSQGLDSEKKKKGVGVTVSHLFSGLVKKGS